MSAIDLVERVARAIYEQQFPGSAWPESADRADAWRDMARAAIEAQSDTITRLQAALKPFADCCEFIDESEDDDEWAKFRLVIKNYRDARDALRSSVGGE